MARVNVILSEEISLLVLRAVAKACCGEFFGAVTTGGLQFGFGCVKHARLFIRKLAQVNVEAEAI